MNAENRSTARLLTAAVCLLVLAGLLLSACSQPAPTFEEQGLVGLWESVRRSGQGRGNSLAIRADSTAAKFIVMMQEMRYELNDSLLTVYRSVVTGDSTQPDSVIAVTYHYTLDADTLQRTLGERTEWLARLDTGSAPAGIVGTWRMARSTDLLTIHSFERYTEDGRLQTRLPLQAKEGRCEALGDTLLALFPDENPRRLTFRVSGDTLWMTRIGGAEYTYLRTAPGDWYYLEEIPTAPPSTP